MSSQFARVSEGPSSIDQFSSDRYLSGPKNFLESNSIVAKFAFLLLILIIFVVLLRLGASLLTWIFSASPNPILIDGMVNAKQMMRISQNPSVNGSIPIIRSTDQSDGLVFTWSVYIYIDDLQYRNNEYKHIFHKGNDDINVTKVPIGMNHPNNAPGLYIAPKTNDLIVVMNTFDSINQEVVIPDIPLNKWVNVIIRVDEQHTLDVYINGRLARRHILNGVPKQNYGDVFVSMNGGFSGYTSSLRYFAEAIGTSQIQSIVDAGPNMKMAGNTMTDSTPSYLSLRWFFADANDMYNP